MEAPTEIRIVAPTGCLGYGFSRSDFARAMAEFRPHVIAVDAGSTDPGPYYLGAGESFTDAVEIMSELAVLIEAALEANIPLIVGTAGGAGGRPHVEWTRTIVDQLARERGWSFRLALIDAEQPLGYVAEKLATGDVVAFDSGQELDADAISASSRIVAQMGAEPIIEALRRGAQIVLAGRACDDAVFAAVPLLHGFDPGLALHLGKILECGALASEPISMDVMLGRLGSDYFDVVPGSEHRRCTVTSIAAHSLYERENPILQAGPGGAVELASTRVEQLDERTVRVSGSRFVPADEYMVKLEGVRRVGSRTISIAGVRDPVMVASIDQALTEAEKRTRGYFDEVGIDAGRYRLVAHVYGRDGVMKTLEPLRGQPSHELGLVLEAIADDAEVARAVCHHFAGALLHLDFPGQFNNAGNLAFLYSPAEIDVGDVYEFSVYHLLRVSDPLEPFSIELVDIGDRSTTDRTPAEVGSRG